MMELNKVYNVDCFEGLKKLADQSIDMVITSPPYWALRKYFSGVTFKKEISEEKKKEVIDNLNKKGIKPKNI